ncbi:MAG: CDP-glucose 4,6-dehydratase [Leptospirillum sp.]
MNPSFWNKKKVLITGHTGFKGSWLSLWLQSAGADVVGYSLPTPTNPSLFELANVASGMVSLTGDVRDLEQVESAIRSHRPEVVFHMAAQALVRPSYQNPVETYATNVMGTVNLLDVIRRIGGTKVVVNVTSDKCYENREWVWGYRENEPMGGHDPYSNSKGCSELVTAAFRSSFFPPGEYGRHGVALASARAGNVIGGGDWAEDRLIPDIMRSFMNREKVTIRNPHAIRPWQHVLEPLSGYLLLAEKLWENGPEYAEGWNFGPNDDDARPVSWIADRLTAMWGDDAGWKRSKEEHPHEANSLRLDSSKARSRLGWHPRWNMAIALEETTVWYRSYQAGKNTRDVVLEQIQHYCRI